MKLNLGHTLGHGVEARSHFGLSHGKSVSIGMAMVSRAAVKKGMLSQEDGDTIQQTLSAYGLPIRTEYPAEELVSYMLSDKKRSGGTIPLIIPTEIGHCDIVPTPVEELTAFVKAGF